MHFARALLFLLLLASAAPAEEWKLVWSDEFNTPGLPDKAKWDYEEGFERNQERQYYTRDRLENARVENGLLVIEGRKESYTPPANRKTSRSPRPVEYTSASLITLHRAAWRYGRIEMRAKLPAGEGVWPAFWAMGTNRTDRGWPACGEIDIMEFIGREPDLVHGTVHFAAPGGGGHLSNGGKLQTERPSDDFHVYAIEWSADRIDFFFDDRKYHSFPIDEAGAGPDNPFRKPHYLLVNLALGGTWGGKLDDTILPQRYLIDYIRVYSAEAATSPDRAIQPKP